MATQANINKSGKLAPTSKSKGKSATKAAKNPRNDMKAGEQTPAEVPQATIIETMPAIPEQIVQLDLALVDSNPYNPRRFHNEAELRELAASITRHGIIHPVTVRQVGERYQIVCGERRFLASMVAELHAIPAVVRMFSDAQALEITLIENLQRKDISPTEESAAFCRLMEVRGASIAELVLYSGKSESYVRQRIQLRNLIEEVALMLAEEQISLSNALELSRYNQQIQQDVLNEHLHEGAYSFWRELKTPVFRQRLDSNYGTDLALQPFDKAQCTGCNFNSATYDLFACQEECGHCQNPTCLRAKIEEHRLGQVMKLAAENPGAEMVASPSGYVSENLIEKLDSLGYDVKENFDTERPEVPEAPFRANYADDEDFQEAVQEYGQEMEAYKEELGDLERMVADGRARKLIDISEPEPVVCYKVLDDDQKDDAADSEGDDSGNNGGQAVSDKTLNERINARTIAELQAKQKRYREIAIEHSVDDVKEMMRSVAVEAKTFMPTEMAMLYFFLMNHTRRGHIEAVGGTNIYLSEQDRHRLMSSLDETQQNIVLRDYIHSKLLNEASGDTIRGRMLLDFAAMHFPAETADICRKYEKIYTQRSASIHQRIAALQVDTATQEDEQAVDLATIEDSEIASQGITGEITTKAPLELAQFAGDGNPQQEAASAQAA